MFKTFIRLASILAIIGMLAFGLAPVKHVYAQGSLTWTSSVNIYNPGATLANVTFTYYNSSDGSVAGTASDTVAATSSNSYFPITGVPAGFNGSLVISSDQPLVTITDLMTPDFHYSAATNGFSAGATSLNLPLIMCNNSSYNTFFSIQNAGSADANITINYKNGGSAGVDGSETATIHVGASKSFDQSVGSTTKNCTTLGNGVGSKFIGSATITSDQPIVGVGFILNTTSHPSLSGYGGFTAGATTVVVPLIMSNNSGYWTSINAQNVGSAAGDITIHYGPNLATGGFVPGDESCTAVAVGALCVKLHNTGQWTGKYIGSATITSTQPLVAIVNELNVGTNYHAAAYEGFDPAAATATFDAPLLMANNGGFNTSLNMMNVGTGTCNVTVTYAPNKNGVFAPVPDTFTLAVNASKVLLQSGTTAQNGGANNWGSAGRYVGGASAVGTGTGCKIVSVINQLGTGSFDNLLSSDAFNR